MTREIYDQWHNCLSQQEDIADAPWHQMAKQHLGNLSNQDVLEIGCGRGGFSKYLAENGANLVAADFSQSAVSITQKNLECFEQCKAIIADIEAIPFPENTFDVVVSLETLEHIPNPSQGLAELVRVTKPKGKLIISTPNYFGLLGIYRFYREVTGRPYTEMGQPINQPIKLFESVKQLKKLNCKIEKVDGCGHYLYLPKTYGIRVTWLDEPKFIMKWIAAHSLTIATKL